MFSELIGPIHGAAIYQVAALLIFLGAFIFLAVRGVRMDRRVVKHLKNLPLDTEHPIRTGEEQSV